MKYVIRFLRYLRPYWLLASVSVVITLLSVLASLLQPWPLQIIIDYVLSSNPLPLWLQELPAWITASQTSLLIFAVLASLGIALLGNSLNILENYVNTRIHQNLALDFRSDLFMHAQKLSLSWHDQHRSGRVIYGINYHANGAATLVMTIPPLAQSVLTLLGMFWITFTMDPLLAIVAVTVVPFMYYSVGYYVKRIQPQLYQVKNMEGQSLSIIHEAMAMLRVIVAFGREQYEHDRFREQGLRTADARVRITFRQTMFSFAINMTTAIGSALVLGIGAYQVLQGKLTSGQLLVIIAYIAAVYKPLETISHTIGSIQEQVVGMQIAYDIMDTKPDIQDAPNAIRLKRARGQIRFEQVHFSYTHRQDTLSDISFDAQPGQVIAIVGPTGAGKTTLVSLIPRFYEATQGRILLDGTDIRQLALESLRDQISIVLQEPLLFSATIAENIAYGRLDASMDEIIAAAKAANAHDFIMRLPDKYKSSVGERGVTLSGGERQRIAVARAFLKDAPILILDEPTSSIDSKTEAVILDALDELMVGRTTFMIAHRLSTLRYTDRILVMEHGRIVQQGTHQQLLKQEGLYKQLYELQLGSKREARVVLAPLPVAK